MPAVALLAGGSALSSPCGTAAQRNFGVEYKSDSCESLLL